MLPMIQALHRALQISASLGRISEIQSIKEMDDSLLLL